MKDFDHILSLQETEELCRLYMECQLSTLEEKELQLLLTEFSYSSPVIDEARESMIAEGLLSRVKVPRHKTKRKWTVLRIAGIAASLAVIITLGVFFAGSDRTIDNLPGSDYASIPPDSSGEVVVAYESGHRLSPEASEKAVEESLRKAESLMAMAEAQEREDELRQEYFMHLKYNEK